MGMIERRSHLRFSLEAAASGSVRQIVGKQLDRNRPLKLGIVSAKYHAHPAFADFRLDFILAELCARGQPLGGGFHDPVL
jgi:hypothetical protein